ncbi:M42 family metallopeptidase [Planomicrobium sp. CPCC 101079]|uniref:M42 family metallopeptidase n=1 Tax=Planomicrobium sp. CPCC 101079 TaxID=2599618 RepID=UPI0011B508B1|nr:M42 family metallopeptidase [Planomicrobium sp. CPCC 101079]TWT04961.1 M42 family metallopeptidase [Planomicrobium sp. CPCC 101079]
MKELLERLTSIHGPCGYEDEVAIYIANRLKGQVDSIEIDNAGNLIAIKKGQKPGPRIIVAAHMDEVGFIVKKIEENGLIRFEKLGGHDDRILLSQRVQIKTATGLRTGVIGTISAHMVKFDDPAKVRIHRNLYIDVGAASREEVMELGIEIGDSISWFPHFDFLTETRIAGKAFDDRAGCAILVKALEDLDPADFAGEVTAIFTVQEEVGLRGARVAAHQFDGDVAIALDTTAVSDTPEEMMDKTLELGAGVGIKVIDFSLIANKKVKNHLVKVAKEQGLAYQLEVFPGIGTDAGELSVAQHGIPAGVLSIPSRYAHSSIEVVDLNDVEATRQLLVAFIKDMKYAADYRVKLDLEEAK